MEEEDSAPQPCIYATDFTPVTRCMRAFSCTGIALSPASRCSASGAHELGAVKGILIYADDLQEAALAKVQANFREMIGYAGVAPLTR